jgi:hypothetical protein
MYAEGRLSERSPCEPILHPTYILLYLLYISVSREMRRRRQQLVENEQKTYAVKTNRKSPENNETRLVANNC